MLYPQDIQRLAICLGDLPPVDNRQEVSFEAASDKVLDCVLSLHRRYDEFAVPRIRRFKNRHPDISTLLGLSKCVVQCGGLYEFYKDELDYEYAEAAEMFGRVLDYLIHELDKFQDNTEMEKCRSWAVSASIDGYQRIWNGSNIPLFGIAGWQYLRMLFGADTCKPDIAVKGYVEGCLQRGFSAQSIVMLMEEAASLAPTIGNFPQPVREADRRIWHQYNIRKNRNKSTCR